MNTLITRILTVLCCLSTVVTFSQRGKDGDYTATAANEIVNTFTTLTADASAGDQQIFLGNNSMNGGAFGGVLAPGDLLLIIQLQGATMDINTTPTTAWGGEYTIPNNWLVNFPNNFDTNFHEWGGITSMEDAGAFERVEVESVAGGTTVNLQCGLKNDYTAAGHVQVIRIPRFNNLTVNGGASITAPAWNGNTGGIVALEVETNLTLNGTIDVSEIGFRGGQTDPNSLTATPATNDFRYLGSNNFMQGSEKGEGIGGFYAEYDALESRYGRGAPANGGGGGGFQNTGGGGGSNFANGTYTGLGNPQGYAAIWNLEQAGLGGSTSPGGGRGGYAYSANDANETTQGPNNGVWGGDSRKTNGGFGGHNIPYDASLLFFGGGGGAGDQDAGDGVLDGGDGGRGGGAILLTCYGTITGNGTMDAHGQDGEDSNPTNAAPSFGNSRRGIDGAGGGGAGGSIHIENANAIPASVTLDVHGGNGGDHAIVLLNGALASEGSGPGGSGTGGYVAYSSGTPTKVLTAGTGGVTASTHLTNFPPNGATEGSDAIDNLSVLTFFDLTPTGATICANNTANLSVVLSGNLPAGGSINWYDQEFGGTALGTGTSFTTGVLTTTTTFYVGVCPGTFRLPVVVTVTPADDPTFTMSPECDGGTATITGTTGGTFSFNTAPGDAAVIDPSSGTVSGGTSGTTYDVLYTTNGTCPSTLVVSVTASTGDDASFTTTATCDGGTMTITGTTGGTFSFNTAPGDAAVIDPASGAITGGTSGTTYDVLYTTAGVCSANSTQMVTALAADDASFTTTSTCDGGTMTITGTTGGTFSFNTAPGDAAVIDPTSGTITGGTGGTAYDVLYATAGTCSANSTQMVTALTTDDASFTTTPTCDGGTMTITGTTGGTFSFNAAPIDAASIDPTSGTITGGTSGTSYEILYTTSGACPANSAQMVTASLTDDASFTMTATCDGGTATLTGTTGGTFTFNTAPGDAASIDPTSGTITGGTSGATYDVQYATTGACAASSTQMVTASLTDDASFTTTATCDGGTMTLTGTTGGTFSFNTAPSDAASIDPTSGTITGGTSGTTYDVQYATTGACAASSTQMVTAITQDDASFTTTATCDGGTMTITGTTGGTFSFNTAPGDAATIDPTSGAITGGTSGTTYDVLYTTVGTCPNTSTQMVTAATADVATFTLTATCDGGTATITGTTGGTFSFNTAPGDAASIDPASGTITGGTSGTTYDVLYTTVGACPANSTQMVTALTADVATFTTTATCDGGTATITGTTGGTFSFNTAPGDAAVIDPTSGTITGGTSGATYDVLYTTTGACPDNSTQMVTVLTQDVASFTITPTCDGGTMTITGTTGGTFSFAVAPTDAAMIDGTSGTVSTATSGATYDITYTTNGTCPATVTQALTVLTADDATFTTTATCDGGTTTITGTTGGTFSFDTAPLDAAMIDPSSGTVSGGTSGTSYDILYTTNGTCPANSVQTVTAVMMDDASFTATGTCEGGTMTITGTTGGTFSFAVVPTDGAIIDPATGEVTNGTSGATYSIEYATMGVCAAASVENVTVLLTPEIDMIADQNVCDQYVLPVITGTNLSGTEAFYAGSQMAGGIALTGQITSTQTVYMFDSNAGCTDEISFMVTVNITEDASFSVSDFCEGDANAAVITGTTGGDFTIIPAPADGATINATTGEIIGGVGGTSYTVEYMTSGACPESTIETVTVNAIPAIPAVSSDETYCTTDPLVDMTATGTGGTITWYDDFGLSSSIGTGGTQTPFDWNGMTTYYVTETILGCEGLPAEVTITIEDCEIIVPTAITPDADGVNDDWELVHIDNIYPNNTVRVYNRWGSLIYESIQGDYNSNRWDGTYKGEQLPVGSYYFVIEFNDDKTESKTGSVSIILGK